MKAIQEKAKQGATFVSRYRVVLERRSSDRRGRAIRLDHPEKTAGWLSSFVAPYDRKILGALYLDAGLYLFGHHVAYVGTRWVLRAEPRGVFVPALLARACSLVVFQNHLSPEHPAPSRDDILLQYHVRKAGEMLQIPVIDYLIVDAEGRFTRLSLPRGGSSC